MEASISWTVFLPVFGLLLLRMGNAQSTTEILVCLLLERITTSIFDYDRSRAAIDMGVQYVNDNILPSGFSLKTRYTDIGRTCSGKTHVVAYAMQLIKSGVNCSVYVGPGCGSAAEVLYDLADYYNTPMIGLPAAAAGLSAPFAEYKNMVR